MRTLLLFTALLLGAFSFVPQFTAQEKGADVFLKTKNGHPALSHNLVLREEQEGIGGVSIKSWVLTPGGKWTVEHKVLDLEGHAKPNYPRVLRSGELSDAEVLRLAGALRSRSFFDLPATMGTKAPVNVHSYSLEFGKKRSTLYGIPPLRKGTLEGHIAAWAPKDTPKQAKQFAAVAQTILDVCQAKDPSNDSTAQSAPR
jgi:hypothetical protein